MIKLSTKGLLKHQKEFFMSEDPFLALVGGFGCGKTHSIIAKTLKNQLKYINKKGRDNGWAIYPKMSLGKELFIPHFIEKLEDCGIKYNFNKTESIITTVYGSIKLYSMEKPQRIVGSELTYCFFDEFDTGLEKNVMEAYLKAVGRMRGSEKAQVYIVTTPEGFKSTYKLFVEQNTGDKKLIRAKTTDNHHLPKSYIEKLKSQYDEKLLAQYLNGEFVNMKGFSAYYSFDRDKNIENISKQNNFILVGMDFNVNPMTAVCGNIVDGKLYIFKEYYLKNSNTYEMVDLIKRDFPNCTIEVNPDMTGIKRSTSSMGRTDIDIIRAAGFRVKGSINPLVKDRLNTVNNILEKGNLIIDKSCKFLIRDLEQVTLDDNGRLDGSNKDLTHISDALGYLANNYFYNKKPSWKG